VIILEAIALNLPAYLSRPGEADYYFGDLRYDASRDCWEIRGEPVVCQVAKRLFPGADGRGKGVARFKLTKRTAGDLNWLMLRYPLRIENPERWEQDYRAAVEHTERLRLARTGPQKMTPSSSFFNGTLKEFQKEAVAYLKHHAPCLLADDMGLGKTIEALAWAATLEQLPGIIVVPASVQRQWAEQIRKFIQPQFVEGSLFPEIIVHTIKGLTPYELPQAHFYIIHYGLLRGWKNYLPYYGFKFVIFDEIQELRHRGTEKYSAASMLAESVREVVGLSGTPIYGRGGEIFNIMDVLDRGCLGDWDSFTREWCDGQGSDVVTDPDMLGDHLRREGLMLRRTKEDVLDELPPKRRVVQYIDSDDRVFSEQMKEVIRLIGQHDEAEEAFEKGRIKRKIGERVRQATGISKAPYVAEFVKMLLDSGEAVVLYGYHHEVYNIWRTKLASYKPVFITGEETEREKDEAKRAFIEGKTNLCVISLRAAAGLDGIQYRANINVFGELDWSPGIHAQCEDRTHRMGQRDSVLSYYLVCSEGSDEQMMDALGFKTEQFLGIMGGTGETEQDRELAQVEVGKHLDRVIAKYRKAGAK
jgi:SWI/SNF-related matrix-associated actin-dependent regulator 1 of chromatin subfamily A